MTSPFVANRIQTALLGFAVLAAVPLSAHADPLKVKSLIAQAEMHERQFEWDKACELYEAAGRLHKSPDLKDRYQHSLRRYWQTSRHRDLSYTKEVLSLDHGQAVRLYSIVRDTLEYGVERKKLTPAKIFRKGLEELESALNDPLFVQQYLPTARTREIERFRTALRRYDALAASADDVEKMTRLVREVAVMGQNVLQLKSTVTIMEFACGACYSLDEYTAYLTPNQLRELCESVKGRDAGTMEFLRSVEFDMKNDFVGYVAITCFQETTTQELDEALNALTKANMKALILDLRGNPGGVFESAIDAARRFLTSGTIASTEHSDPKYNAIYQSRNAEALTMPMIVLVDNDTASAAEVLAGALKENDRARLIGQPTFGKGCTQCLVKLPAATGVPTGGLRLTVARFYSPKGLPYNGRGVSPDVLVERTNGMMMDIQLTDALSELDRLFSVMMAKP